MRDSGIDGSGAVLIDDARNFAFLETGWAEPAPGAPNPMGPVTVWRGYGRAIDEFGSQGPAVWFTPASTTTDNGWTLIPRGPVDTLPDWKPTNHFMDNIAVIGTPLECSLNLAGDALIDAADLAKLLSSWSPCNCPEDYNFDGPVNANDLALLLSVWGGVLPVTRP